MIARSAAAQKGGASMPGLRPLIPWIEQGTEHFKDTTRRAVDFSTLAESAEPARCGASTSGDGLGHHETG